MPIRSYLDGFEPETIEAMSKALEDACKALHIDGQINEREVVATRIIDLARSGFIDVRVLTERVVAEVKAMRSR